ncbi:cytochrome C [Thiobacter aerophilum]|uniref:Cytochrome C n=1 Tax=Thiobacter aerophilum TaxID=3121275 RepID=A0ABV0EBW9_9BURK
MKTTAFWSGIVLISLSAVALADTRNLSADGPPIFQAECGSCHIAFPPQLMAAEDWKRVMAKLDKHYGEDASVDERSRHELEQFLVRNAGSASTLGVATTQANALPRLTRTAWFLRKHRQVSPADWRHPKVRTPANCAACHRRAAEGRFHEREITMPDGRRWEDR